MLQRGTNYEGAHCVGETRQGNFCLQMKCVFSLLILSSPFLPIPIFSSSSFCRQLLEDVVDLCEQNFVKEGKRWKKFKEKLGGLTASLTQNLDAK